MTKDNVLPINKLGDDIDNITLKLIELFNTQLQEGKPDLKVLSAIRDTYKDKLEFYKFMLGHQLKQEKHEAELPEATKRKKLADVEVK